MYLPHMFLEFVFPEVGASALGSGRVCVILTSWNWTVQQAYLKMDGLVVLFFLAVSGCHAHVLPWAELKVQLLWSGQFLFQRLGKTFVKSNMSGISFCNSAQVALTYPLKPTYMYYSGRHPLHKCICKLDAS